MIEVQVPGLDQVINALNLYPAEQQRALQDAATLAGDKVLNTVGLRKYPPETSANHPPPPYYIRGRGMEVFARLTRFVSARTTKFNRFTMKESYSKPGYYAERTTKNLNNSERLGTKFYTLGEVRTLGSAAVRIGNTASYAKHVIGDDDQAQFMAAKGWRKLGEVAREKVGEIRDVFEAVVIATLQRIRLQ